MIDYYEVLKLAPDASEDAIEERYEFLLGNLQAEGLGGDDADRDFAQAKDEIRLLNSAYEMLHDFGRRRRCCGEVRYLGIKSHAESQS